MIRADFHIHSRFSHDSFSTIEQIVKSALLNRLDLIAVTDHDTVKGGLALCEYLKENPCGVMGVSGVEKTVEGGTHLLCLGVSREIKSRKFRDVFDEVKSLGGIVGLAHPFRIDTGFFYNKQHKDCFSNEDLDFAMKNVDFIELVNSKSFFENKESLLKLAKDYPKASFIASSDAHAYYEIANAYSVFEKFCMDKLDLKSLIGSECKMFIYSRDKRVFKDKSSSRVFIGMALKFFRLRRIFNTLFLYLNFLRRRGRNLEKNRMLKLQSKEKVILEKDRCAIILLK